VPPSPDRPEPESFDLPRHRSVAGPLGVVVGVLVLALVAGALYWTRVPIVGRTVRRDTSVSLRTEQPPRIITVPALTGIQLEEARQRLADVGLLPGTLARADAGDTPAGTVLRQAPPSGTALREGATVDLWLAQHPILSVPSLVGLTEARALIVARGAGLSVEFLSEITDRVPPQAVIRQSPPAGDAISAGSKIVAVINGAPAGVATAATTPSSPTLFVTLAGSLPFPVLFPGRLPPGLVLEQSSDNPRLVRDPRGRTGVEVRYVDPSRPTVRLSLFEGDWFDPALESAIAVEVRGGRGSLAQYPDTILLTWTERGTAYGVSANGLGRPDVLSFAEALQYVGDLSGVDGEGTGPAVGEHVQSGVQAGSVSSPLDGSTTP
jgi:beta-lactam-binding protein with PASTA domain